MELNRDFKNKLNLNNVDHRATSYGSSVKLIEPAQRAIKYSFSAKFKNLRTPIWLQNIFNTSMEVLFSEESKTDPYRWDILKNLVEKEAEKPRTYLRSPQLNYRGTLVCIMRKAAAHLELSRSTLHLGIWLLDMFMDDHDLRQDRLQHLAVVCLLLAAKVDDKHNIIPEIRKLRLMSGPPLSIFLIKKLEWMVAKHARWRFLTPTTVTFALLLAPYIVTELDLKTLVSPDVKWLQGEAVRLLNTYLDLTLSDVRFNVVDSSVIAWACIASTRSDLNFRCLPECLFGKIKCPTVQVTPLIKLLKRMMQAIKQQNSPLKSEISKEVDQGYVSARATPSPTTSSCVDSPESITSIETRTKITTETNRSPVKNGQTNHLHTLLSNTNNSRRTQQYLNKSRLNQLLTEQSHTNQFIKRSSKHLDMHQITEGPKRFRISFQEDVQSDESEEL